MICLVKATVGGDRDDNIQAQEWRYVRTYSMATCVEMNCFVKRSYRLAELICASTVRRSWYIDKR
jgi:hypothetical protein